MFFFRVRINEYHLDCEQQSENIKTNYGEATSLVLQFVSCFACLAVRNQF